MDCGTPDCHIGVEVVDTSFGCPLYNFDPGMERSRVSRALERSFSAAQENEQFSRVYRPGTVLGPL